MCLIHCCRMCQRGHKNCMPQLAFKYFEWALVHLVNGVFSWMISARLDLASCLKLLPRSAKKSSICYNSCWKTRERSTFLPASVATSSLWKKFLSAFKDFFLLLLFLSTTSESEAKVGALFLLIETSRGTVCWIIRFSINWCSKSFPCSLAWRIWSLMISDATSLVVIQRKSLAWENTLNLINWFTSA